MTEWQARTAVPQSALALGLLGLLPFAAGAVLAWFPVSFVAPGTGVRLEIIYAALILSFLGGIRWGTALGPFGSGRQTFEFTVSVLGSLAGLAAMFIPPVPALTLLVTGFLMQGLWDVTSVEAGRLPVWFGRLRMLLTAGAVIALLLTLLAAVLT